MSKHKVYRTETPPKPSKLPLHPIWRGIGCILLIFIPLLSYLVASSLIKNQQNIPWLVIPQDLVFSQFRDSLIVVKLMYAGILVLAIGAVLALVTFVLNRIFGPSRFGPHDIPPEKVHKLRR